MHLKEVWHNVIYKLREELNKYGYLFTTKYDYNGIPIVNIINLEENTIARIRVLEGIQTYSLQLTNENFKLHTGSVMDIIGILEYKC